MHASSLLSLLFGRNWHLVYNDNAFAEPRTLIIRQLVKIDINNRPFGHMSRDCDLCMTRDLVTVSRVAVRPTIVC